MVIAFIIYRSRRVKFVQDFHLAIISLKVTLCSFDFYIHSLCLYISFFFFFYDCLKNHTYTYIIVFIR